MSLADALRPEVLGLAHGPFRLDRDLDRLDRVRAAGAWEATVFHAARVLEATARCALDDLGLDVGVNAFQNLVVLESVGRIDVSAAHVGHGLRHLGNVARHALEAVARPEADAAVALMAAWLEALLAPGADAGLARGGGRWRPEAGTCGRLLGALLDDLGADRAPEDATVEALFAADDLADAGGRTLLALAGEALLDVGDDARAAAFLQRARATHPDDERLRQLDALRRHRSGDPDAAIRLLEAEVDSGRGDPEAVGILAAALKARSRQPGGTPEDLARAHRLYRDGWRASGRRNTWLGINAATTALLLGDAPAAAGLGGEVGERLEARAAALDRALGATRPRPYWFEVTRAEAQLLAGEHAAAARLYADAFAAHAGRAGAIGATRRQADLVLQRQGAGRTLDDLLADVARTRPPARPSPSPGEMPWDS